ncbi:Thioesterase thiol ester dehydrase-isomerase [Pyrenophora seminiperda CCB06]|uniref:Thioesterase thiol ester dehydrase-isomerase n=1 Tax=Pyrenophora seminiperda CCB06 TaxID=1302712 RepID=A0A3M7MIY7_9PLEO|nr:Thioesterase thiol ester dehydrase-isomerase [Pyrenophora seminiperda CCB06]
MSTHQAVRRWIMTGAVVAITVTGSIYGADLKGYQDAKQQKRKLLETTPEERIAQLETVRAELVIKKTEMERKIARIQENRKAREEEQTRG